MRSRSGKCRESNEAQDWDPLFIAWESPHVLSSAPLPHVQCRCGILYSTYCLWNSLLEGVNQFFDQLDAEFTAISKLHCMHPTLSSICDRYRCKEGS
jgi:hypothetical protein